MLVGWRVHVPRNRRGDNMANRQERRAKKQQQTSPAANSAAKPNPVTAAPSGSIRSTPPEPAGTTGFLKSTSLAPLPVKPPAPAQAKPETVAGPEPRALTPEAKKTPPVPPLPGAPVGITEKVIARSAFPSTSASESSSKQSSATKVTFVLMAPDAKRVCLTGEFNEWSPEATPMKKQEGGRWETTVVLAPGRYQYKFLVDGEWIHDPNAGENVPNQHGSLNSVREVRR